MTELSEDGLVKREKAERLKNSLPFDVHRWSDYLEVNAAVDYLYQEYQSSCPGKLKQNVQKKHIKVLVLDLYVKYLTDPQMYISISRRKQDYVDSQGRYNKLHISYVSVTVMDWMHQEGLIEMHVGHYGRDGVHSSRRTRIRVTSKLIKLIEEKYYIKPHMIEREPSMECIILKDEDKHEISYEDTAEIHCMREDLTAYNNLLHYSFIDIPDAPGQRIPRKAGRGEDGPRYIRIGDEYKFVRRIFNNGSWLQGGRYAGGWWQCIPKAWRERIRINNLPTSEVDYSNLHIVLLYALAGIDYWTTDGDDAYSLPGYECFDQLRDLLKVVLLVAVNASSKKQAVQAIQKEVNLKMEFEWVKTSGIDVGQLIDDFAERHRPIHHSFFSEQGLELQYLDSRIAELVVNHFTGKGVPVLCIHDSFVIQGDKGTELNQVMNRAYSTILEELGVNRPQTRLKSSGMKPGRWQEMQKEPTGREYRQFHREQQLLVIDHPEYRERFRQHKQRTFSGEVRQDWYGLD